MRIIINTIRILSLMLLLYAGSLSAQTCGYAPGLGCSNTDYNNAFRNSSNPATIEYDNWVGMFHATLTRRSDGQFALWGEDAHPDGTTDLLSPIILNAANGYTALGTATVLKVTGGGGGLNDEQFIALATDGLYAWGVVGGVLSSTIKSTTAFSKLTINGQSDGLPAGVDPVDVKMLTASRRVLVLVTCSGSVYVLARTENAGNNSATNIRGAGAAGTSETQWYQVTSSASGNPALSNIVAARVSGYTAMALDASGNIYTWGDITRLGNGTNPINSALDRATPMTHPAAGKTIKMIGISRPSAFNIGTPTYFVLTTDGNLYSMGNDGNEMLGDFGTTSNSSVWTQPRYASGGQVMNDISWISPSENSLNATAGRAISVVNTSGHLWAWGSNNASWIGGASASASYNPIRPAGSNSLNVTGVETGGHTLMITACGVNNFGYVGHRINGSMGNGDATNTTEASFTFATPYVPICGTQTPAFNGFTPTSVRSSGGSLCVGEVYNVVVEPAGGVVSITSNPGSIAALTGNASSGYQLQFTGAGTVTLSYQAPTANGCTPAAVTTNVTAASCLRFSQQPQLQYGCIGYANTFSATATASSAGNTLSYQWRKGTTNITNATNSTFRIQSVSASDSGSWANAYNVVVTERTPGNVVVGTITSEPAWLVLNKQAEYTGPATGGSTDWLTPSNWSTNAVPDSSIHAYIPATVTNMNLTSGTLKCKCLTIETGAKVTVNGGTLEIAGRINNSATEASPTTFGGTLNVVNGSVVMNGTSVIQKLWDNVFETNFIKDLTIGNEVGVNLEGDLSLTGVYTPIFSPSTRVLNIATNKRLILKSTATNTARVITGPSTGGYINGAVTVERYLYPHPGRRWTAMAAPVSQLISESWQEDIYVTGPGTGGFMCAPPFSTNTQPTQHTNGMDATQLNPVSMQTFNTPGGWTAITNTLATSLTPGKGYFVNVRGDRKIHGCALLQFTNPQTPTTQTFEATVKATGTLTQGNFSIPTTSTGFYLVGNPYASEISFSSLYGGNSGNMQNKYWLTNPATQDGNYMTWDGTNHAGAASGYSNFDRIASGQSFFVNMTTPNSTISFTESMKVNARQQGGFKTTVFGGKLRVNIYRSGDSLKQDDALIVFDQPTSSTNNTVSAIDSRSINTGSVVVATWKGTTRLAINKRADNFTTDTVGVYVNAGIVGGYSFHFTELNTLTGATVYLLDNQTNTLHNVSQTPTYSFNVATAGVINNRFQIIFQTNPLSADELEFRAQNVDGYGHLSWSVQSAKGRVRYDVQSSEDGISFTEIGSKEAKEEVSGASYRFEDTRLIEGRRFYRIEANHEDGSRSFSHTKMVSNVGNSSFSFSIAPNPVSDKLNVVFMGNEASHTIRIYDVAGKLMHEQVTGGKDCVVNTSAYAAGSYLVEVTSVNGTKQTKKFIK